MQKREKRLGFFCKDPECRKTHEFHSLPKDKVLWDLWPQKIECPRSGRRYEYWKDDIRAAGYI